MHSKRVICSIIPALLLTIAGQSVADDCFKTRMTRDQVVNQQGDPDDPHADRRRGNAKVHFKKAFSKARFRVAVRRFENDTELEQVHLHCGAAGADGDLLVNLPLDNIKETEKKIIVKGKFVADDVLQAACNGTDLNSLEDLAQAMEDGDVYTHTHPQDETEIRGQLENACQ